MNFATTPREIRERLNLTQQEMAKGVGVNVSTIWRWEASGVPVKGPAMMLLDRLAKEAGFSGLKSRPSNDGA